MTKPRFNHNPMNDLEKRAVIALSGVFGLRMFGLFLVLPMIALYVAGLHGATPFLIGLSLGAYGLTQALLQIPFGILSDRFGRKPLIVFGLVVFCIGSIVAAVADTAAGVVIGRALQGSGAVAAVILAFVADLTRTFLDHRVFVDSSNWFSIVGGADSKNRFS